MIHSLLSRFRGLALALFAAALLLGAGCTVDPPSAEGRPCDNNQACGPGTTCDPKTKTCVTQGGRDAGEDGPADAARDGSGDGAPDGKILPPDQGPDRFIAPDGGCPKGYTRCGNQCVNTQNDLKHCGGCNQACDTSRSDRCVQGSCHCGGNPLCGAALDCRNQRCLCVKGGNCSGCCSGGACVTGSSQGTKACGKGGEPCKTCSDGNDCTADACSSGTCTFAPVKDGTTCNDGVACTYADRCSSGKCSGTTYSCTPNVCQTASVCNGTGGCSTTNKPNGTGCNDGVACSYSDKCQNGVCRGTAYSCSDTYSCTTDTCLGTAPAPAGCKNTLQSTSCLIAGTCYSSGAARPGQTYACYRCQPSLSQSGWTLGAYKNCVVTHAGQTSSGSTNGSTSVARFYRPSDVAVDGSGRIYVVDRGNHLIRRISGSTVTTFAGSSGGYADGPALSAKFFEPMGLWATSSGTIYVSDRGNNRIRRISGGQVTTIAGTGASGFADGSTLTAQFRSPNDVAVAPDGALVVVDTFNNRIRRIYGGQVTTIAGSGATGSSNGAALSATFDRPKGLAIDSSGRIYIADGGNSLIRLLYGGQVTTVAGSSGGWADGAALSAKLYWPQNLVLVGSALYIADRSNNRIRRLYSGQLTTVAGTGAASFADGGINVAAFNFPWGIAYYGGSLYVADYYNNRIRRVVIN